MAPGMGVGSPGTLKEMSPPAFLRNMRACDAARELQGRTPRVPRRQELSSTSLQRLPATPVPAGTLQPNGECMVLHERGLEAAAH